MSKHRPPIVLSILFWTFTGFVIAAGYVQHRWHQLTGRAYPRSVRR